MNGSRTKLKVKTLFVLFLDGSFKVTFNAGQIWTLMKIEDDCYRLARNNVEVCLTTSHINKHFEVLL